MPELVNNNDNIFKTDFLKFRRRYYFNETKELLARHKLLTAFIICLLAPGIKNLQAIGAPFYAIIDPAFTFGSKLLFLAPLIFFLIALTTAQSKFIKGGAFREYLHTLSIASNVHKTIDISILLLSLNVVWIAILFGAAKIYQLPVKPVYLLSYFLLYFSMISAMLALLLNSLYKNTVGALGLILSLILIAAISTQESWLLNMITALSVSLLSGAIALKAQPSKKKKQYLNVINQEKLNPFTAGSFLSVFFLTQIATYRANKTTFYVRVALCLFLSISSFYLFFSDEVIENRGVLLLILINFETYILSTLITFFVKDELDYGVFHALFPFQKFTKRLIEIICISGLLTLSLLPVIVFSLLTTPLYLLPLIAILFMNVVTITINRVLYAYSLRFCLFTSLLSTLGSIPIQYILMGEFFGN